jgi:hypothetical protein
VSAGTFVLASAACGFAGNMTWLIAWRAVQGLGAGGLMVSATALIADVIPLRERGRCQGALGAVFGVTTVIGRSSAACSPDHLSWRPLVRPIERGVKRWPPPHQGEEDRVHGPVTRPGARDAASGVPPCLFSGGRRPPSTHGDATKDL